MKCVCSCCHGVLSPRELLGHMKRSTMFPTRRGDMKMRPCISATFLFVPHIATSIEELKKKKGVIYYRKDKGDVFGSCPCCGKLYDITIDVVERANEVLRWEKHEYGISCIVCTNKKCFTHSLSLLSWNVEDSAYVTSVICKMVGKSRISKYRREHKRTANEASFIRAKLCLDYCNRARVKISPTKKAEFKRLVEEGVKAGVI